MDTTIPEETSLPEVSTLNDNAGLPTTPVLPEEVQPFLNYVQQSYLITGGDTTPTDPNFVPTSTTLAPTTDYSGMTSSEAADASMEDITNLGVAPAPPSLVDLYNSLRSEKGIADLERSVVELRGMADDTAARLRQRSYLERGKAVPMNVMQGRIGQIEQQERENLDFIDRQLNTKMLQLQTANNIVSTMMSLTSQDYANASAYFNNEFSRRMQIHQMYQEEANHDEQIAQSQLEIVTEMIMNGSLNWDSLTEEQKLIYGKLEIAAGFNPGFLSTVKMKPGANIITTSNRTGSDGYNYVDIVTRNPDGSYKVDSVRMGRVSYSGGSGGGRSYSSSGTKSYTETQLNAALKVIKTVDSNGDGLLSKAEYADIVTRMGGDYDLVDAALTRGGYKEWDEAAAKSDQAREAVKKINSALASMNQDTLWRTLNDVQDILGRDHPAVVSGWEEWNKLVQLEKQQGLLKDFY